MQTIRLPPLFAGKESTEGGQQRTAGEPLYDDASLDKDERARRRTFRLPDGGGPFKGFAFAVLGDNAAAERTRTDWAWDRAAVVPEADDEESADESDVAPAPPQELSLVEQAQRRGLRIMPMCVDHSVDRAEEAAPSGTTCAASTCHTSARSARCKTRAPESATLIAIAVDRRGTTIAVRGGTIGGGRIAIDGSTMPRRPSGT